MPVNSIYMYTHLNGTRNGFIYAWGLPPSLRCCPGVGLGRESRSLVKAELWLAEVLDIPRSFASHISPKFSWPLSSP